MVILCCIALRHYLSWKSASHCWHKKTSFILFSTQSYLENIKKVNWWWSTSHGNRSINYTSLALVSVAGWFFFRWFSFRWNNMNKKLNKNLLQFNPVDCNGWLKFLGCRRTVIDAPFSLHHGWLKIRFNLQRTVLLRFRFHPPAGTSRGLMDDLRFVLTSRCNARPEPAKGEEEKVFDLIAFTRVLLIPSPLFEQALNVVLEFFFTISRLPEIRFRKYTHIFLGLNNLYTAFKLYFYPHQH